MTGCDGRALEYEIGGIKTTLPFFREVMDDEEFIAGKLDTGFIPRFNERKKPAEIDEVTRDMAMIASAMAYSKNQKVVHENNSKPSKWVMANRLAMSNSRQ